MGVKMSGFFFLQYLNISPGDHSHLGIWSPGASPGSEPPPDITEVINKNLDVNSYVYLETTRVRVILLISAH